MGYIYATPLQLQQLASLETNLKAAQSYFDKRQQAKLLRTEFIKSIIGLPFRATLDILRNKSYPDTELNELLYKQYPSFEGKANYVTQKIIVTFTNPDQNSQEYQTVFNRLPLGGAFFEKAFNDIFDSLQKKAKTNLDTAKQEFTDYDKFLKEQDKTKDAVVSTASVAATVESFNRVINDISSDPKKIAIYGAVAILIIIIFISIIKKILGS